MLVHSFTNSSAHSYSRRERFLSIWRENLLFTQYGTPGQVRSQPPEQPVDGQSSVAVDRWAVLHQQHLPLPPKHRDTRALKSLTHLPVITLLITTLTTGEIFVLSYIQCCIIFSKQLPENQYAEINHLVIKLGRWRFEKRNDRKI